MECMDSEIEGHNVFHAQRETEEGKGEGVGEVGAWESRGQIEEAIRRYC